MLVTTLTALFAGVAVAHPNTCSALPKNIRLYNGTKRPDPFTTLRSAPVRTKAQWNCRASELSALFQRYELGTLPGPPNKVNTSLNQTSTKSSRLTITPTVGSKTTTFTITIALPSAGKAPYPAVIAFGGLSVPVPSNTATISFDNSGFAQQDSLASRRKGLFYDLFTPNATASALTAWAWGVGNGKGALVAGASDPRIALTNPQESGAGGAACWRRASLQLPHDETVQTASEIVGENVWESVEFRNLGNDTDLLPFDHHESGALIAPRGLIVIDNSDYLWLGPRAGWGRMSAARLVYEAVSAKTNMGSSSASNHGHCLFPTDRELADLQAFYDRFLLDKRANTDIFYNSVSLAFDYSWTYCAGALSVVVMLERCWELVPIVLEKKGERVEKRVVDRSWACVTNHYFVQTPLMSQSSAACYGHTFERVVV